MRTHASARLRITLTNEHLYRLLRSSSGHDSSVRPCDPPPLSSGTQGCLLQRSYPDVTRAYERALQTYEFVLRELMQTSAVALSKAAIFDADLVATMNVIALEKFSVEGARKDLGLGWLWSLLGGSRHEFVNLARNEHVLQRVGDYSARSLRYVRTIQDILEGMERHLEELRLVAAGALVAEPASPEVVLQMLARGFERLGSARAGVTERRIPTPMVEGS